MSGGQRYRSYTYRYCVALDGGADERKSASQFFYRAAVDGAVSGL